MLLQRAIDIASLNPKPLSINFYIKVNSLELSMRRQSESMNISLKTFDDVLLPLYILARKPNDSIETEHSTNWATKSANTNPSSKHKCCYQPAIFQQMWMNSRHSTNLSGEFYCSGPIGKAFNPTPWAHSDGNLREREPVTRSRPDCGLGPQQRLL